MNYQIIVMGVSGCGKSTVGLALAKHLGYTFHDGDDYHPKENIAKMQSGHPLTDNDRQGWLTRLNNILCHEIDGTVLACSALKPEYRHLLSRGVKQARFVYLKGDFETIWIRHQQRKGHYFQGQNLLRSQFDTLVEPTGKHIISVDVRLSVDTIVEKVIEQLQ